MKTKAKIACHSGGDYNTTAAALLIMAGKLMADATPDIAVESKEAARLFVDGVLSAATTGGYTKSDLLRDALASSQRSNRLAMLAHDACKAAGREAMASLIGGGGQ
jgi:ABC-type methionine transport system permease subunit